MAGVSYMALYLRTNNGRGRVDYLDKIEDSISGAIVHGKETIILVI